jgi:hypothetical protein
LYLCGCSFCDWGTSPQKKSVTIFVQVSVHKISPRCCTCKTTSKVSLVEPDLVSWGCFGSQITFLNDFSSHPPPASRVCW